MQASLAATPRPWWEEPDDAPEDENNEDAPLVLVDHGAKGTRISASSPQALAVGLWPDMKLADARAMVPLIHVEQHDKAADGRAQNRLAHWMMRWSPSVSLYGDRGFVLDTTGCDHLFGGEEAMARSIMARLAQLGFTAQVAFADTPGAAIAAAHYGGSALIVLPHGHDVQCLDDLPVEALRLDDDSVLLLKRLGLKRIGDVRPLPRAALERRFRETKATSKKTKDTGKKEAAGHAAQSVQMRLDQLCGTLAEPMQPIATPQPFRMSLQCPDLALDQQAVEEALRRLLNDLCLALEAAQKGGRLFRLTAYRADGGTSSAQVRLSQPVRQPAMIARLFREHLQAIDCGYGIDLFALEAGEVQELDATQLDTTQGSMVSACNGQHNTTSLIAFADTVNNRAGPDRVHRYEMRQSHVPERAQRPVALAQVETQGDAFAAQLPALSSRPLRLLPRPEPADVTAALPDSPPAQFVWRKVLRRVVRARGPERILPEWWKDSFKAKPGASFRDYYDVEDERGLRYWLFRATRDDPVMENSLEEKDETQDDDTSVQTIRRIAWFVHGLF